MTIRTLYYYAVQFDKNFDIEDWTGPYTTLDVASNDVYLINTTDPIPELKWRPFISFEDWTLTRLDLCTDPEASLELREENFCHCGRNIYTYEPEGFTRYLCKWCSDIRCDLPVGEGYTRDCVNQTEKKNEH